MTKTQRNRRRVFRTNAIDEKNIRTVFLAYAEMTFSQIMRQAIKEMARRVKK